jgi:nucleoside-diphosphate-sugar epimerase
VYQQGFANVLQSLPTPPRRVVYVSTTGVYGDAGGTWIDESTQPSPSRDGGRASLAAEEVLRSSEFAVNGVSLRLAGIYGTGRIPYLDALRKHEPIPAPVAGWLNLIHVDDAADVVIAAAMVGKPSPIYCVSDGNPVVRGDYYREVARRIGAPAPRFGDPDPGSARSARAAASKRVNNALMLRELRSELRFPSYLQGLAAALSQSSDFS